MEFLNIRTQQPRIDLNIQRGKLDMRTPPVKLDIDNGSATVDIHTTHATLEIDSYPSRASYGLLSTADQVRQSSQEAKQDAAEGIARRAQEGTAFLETSSPKNVIANREKSKLSEMPTMQVKLCQVTPPTINYTPSEVEFTPKIRPASSKVDAPPVEINYTRPQVNTYVKQKSDVRMWVSEDKYDIYA
ncbi:MAG: hypothetical protein H6Q70_1170 [Firmicutes bacterium]|nr:hypothetical protein [Bacillota bacterium]